MVAIRYMAAALFLLGIASGASAQSSGGDVCSTTVLAEAVIAGAPGQPALVTTVAQSVPTDPQNCVVSYCEASQGATANVQVAVGAGLSFALSSLLASGDDAGAAGLLAGACGGCDEVVLTAFAASQGTTVTGLCTTNLGGDAGQAPGELVIGATGGGGGQVPSGN